MGDIGIDKWVAKMEKHRKDEMADSEDRIFFQEQRIEYWEKYHKILLEA